MCAVGRLPVGLAGWVIAGLALAVWLVLFGGLIVVYLIERAL